MEKGRNLYCMNCKLMFDGWKQADLLSTGISNLRPFLSSLRSCISQTFGSWLCAVAVDQPCKIYSVLYSFLCLFLRRLPWMSSLVSFELFGCSCLVWLAFVCFVLHYHFNCVQLSSKMFRSFCVCYNLCVRIHWKTKTMPCIQIQCFSSKRIFFPLLCISPEHILPILES